MKLQMERANADYKARMVEALRLLIKTFYAVNLINRLDGGVTMVIVDDSATRYVYEAETLEHVIERAARRHTTFFDR